MRTEPPQDEPTTTAVPFCGTCSNERSYPAETTASWTVGSKRPSVSLPGLERERDDLPQLGPGLERARLVQARELRLRAEAREDRLEPVELLLGGGQRVSRRLLRRPGARCRCPSLGTAGSPSRRPRDGQGRQARRRGPREPPRRPAAPCAQSRSATAACEAGRGRRPSGAVRASGPRRSRAGGAARGRRGPSAADPSGSRSPPTGVLRSSPTIRKNTNRARASEYRRATWLVIAALLLDARTRGGRCAARRRPEPVAGTRPAEPALGLEPCAAGTAGRAGGLSRRARAMSRATLSSRCARAEMAAFEALDFADVVWSPAVRVAAATPSAPETPRISATTVTWILFISTSSA